MPDGNSQVDQPAAMPPRCTGVEMKMRIDELRRTVEAMGFERTARILSLASVAAELDAGSAPEGR